MIGLESVELQIKEVSFKAIKQLASNYDLDI